MNLQHAARQASVSQQRHDEAHTRMHGRRRVLVSAGVGAVAMLSLWTFVVRLPAFVIHVQTACVGSPCANGQLTYTDIAALQRLGLSLGVYAALQITLVQLCAVLYLTIAALIVWRKSDDWMALLVVLLLVLWPTSMVTGAFSLDTYSTLQGSQFPNPLVNLLTRFGFFLVFFLFPNGRFVSRWTLVPLGVILADEFSYHFLSYWPVGGSGWPFRFAELLWLAMLLSIVPIQWYRYRHLSTAIERQQIKWAALGISIVTVGFVVRLVLTLLIPRLNEPGSLYNSLSTLVLLYVSLVIPLSIGLAILRYRLWDVDVLINKALVYGLLTGSLAAVYAGLIIGLQSLVHLVTGQVSENPVVVVGSTLLIVALFNPLRRRIQVFIDRRFYRRKYDAAKTLEAFSATLRNEVELTQLREHLVAVVQETMQPAHVSLWLRPSEHAGKHQAPWRANPPVDSQEG